MLGPDRTGMKWQARNVRAGNGVLSYGMAGLIRCEADGRGVAKDGWQVWRG